MRGGGARWNGLPVKRRARVRRGLALFAVAFVLLFTADGSRQPTSGNGWRLVGYQRGLGDRNTIVVVPDAAALAATWDRLRFLADVPHVDFGRSAVFWMVAVGTIGCPARFEGIHVDADRHVVAAAFSRAVTSGCDNQFVSDSFLVAIDRDRLPTAPYRVQLADPLPPEMSRGVVEVPG